MKKTMNNIYEAPKAEVVEIQSVSVLMASSFDNIGGNSGTGFEP